MPWKTRYSDGWVKVKSVMDSGAFECVAPPTLAPGVPIQESPGSRRGQHYISATQNRIPNLGQQTMRATTPEGRRAQVTWQTAEISRPLTAVGSTCDKGNFVGFDSENHCGGFIIPADAPELPMIRQLVQQAQKIKLHREKGVYLMRNWHLDKAPFGGQGQ